MYGISKVSILGIVIVPLGGRYPLFEVLDHWIRLRRKGFGVQDCRMETDPKRTLELVEGPAGWPHATQQSRKLRDQMNLDPEGGVHIRPTHT